MLPVGRKIVEIRAYNTTRASRLTLAKGADAKRGHDNLLFIRYLKGNRSKLALLQLIGRMEDMLVKEFVYHIWYKSQGNR
jgi:hypothetical protein